MKFSDLTVEHPYYCSEANYYSREAKMTYKNWEDFIDDWGSADVEYNHIFRFDVKQYEEGENQGLYYAEIFVMLQRKGLFKPISIKKVSENDKDSMIELLLKHWEEVKKMWKPFS